MPPKRLDFVVALIGYFVHYLTPVSAMRILILLLAFSGAAETQLRSSQLPSGLRRAIDKEFKGHEFVDAYKLREDGKTVYEVVIEHRGQHFIVVGDSREITEVAEAERDHGEEIPISALPKAVKRAAERSITNAGIVEAYELEDAQGRLYEVIVETRRGEYLLVLDPSGRLLEREELEDEPEEERVDEGEEEDAWATAERGRELQVVRAPSSFRRNALAAVKGKLTTVFELKRNGEKYFEFHVQNDDGIHKVILDRKGKHAHTISPGAESDDDEEEEDHE